MTLAKYRVHSIAFRTKTFRSIWLSARGRNKFDFSFPLHGHRISTWTLSRKDAAFQWSSFRKSQLSKWHCFIFTCVYLVSVRPNFFATSHDVFLKDKISCYLGAEFLPTMEELACVRCMSSKFRNPNLVFSFNVCGHTMCANCIEVAFMKGKFFFLNLLKWNKSSSGVIAT